MPINFYDPRSLADGNYEARIFDTGVVATRPNDWHDLFNCLCWLAWPRTKATLNGLHIAEMARQNGKQRSKVRDAATLLDESGLILACSDMEMAQALREQDWHALFVGHQASWGRSVEPYVIGHALMQKGLAPFIGIVAKTIVIEVPSDWFHQDAASKLADLDTRLAAWVQAGGLVSPKLLPPLPVLGIPGWWPIQDAAFYANTEHFRPRRAAFRHESPVTHPV
jgi:hypothetical protein